MTYPFRKSSLDMLRKLEEPTSIEGEDIIKRGQASYDVGGAFSSSWKFGFLCLMVRSLIFMQNDRIIFRIPLDRLQTVIIDRPWILGKMIKQLCVIPEAGVGRRAYYIGISEPQEWKDRIDKVIEERIDAL